jgi:hypothetical protein
MRPTDLTVPFGQDVVSETVTHIKQGNRVANGRNRIVVEPRNLHDLLNTIMGQLEEVKNVFLSSIVQICYILRRA